MENNTTSSKSHAKTIQFELQLNWLEKQRAIATSNDVSDTLRVALPYSFGGSGREWSPEHLFIASISSCFMTTFLILLEKNRLSISNYECQAKGKVEKVDGKYEFTSIELIPKVFVQEAIHLDKVSELLKRTEKYCLVSKAIKIPISYLGEVKVDLRHPIKVSHPLSTLY